MPAVLRLLALVALALLTAACGTKPVVWAPDEAVQAARYRHPGPTEIVLFNVINNASGQGEHAALMINASERVLFDGAGSWTHPLSPERHDVHHGFTDAQLFRYTYYHARRTHHVLKLRLEVSPEVAEAILRLAQAYGPVPDAHCARSIAIILRQIPGFQDIPVSFYPNTLSAAFARIPGVTEERIYSDAEPTEAQQYTQ
jgi:hypothetical protein